MEAGEPYSDVVIDKPIIGETQKGQATGDATGRGGQYQQVRRRSNSRQRKRGTKLGTKLGSSRQRKRGMKLGSSKEPTPVADARGSGPVTHSSKRTRASAERGVGIPKRKSSSPRTPRGATAASSSAGDGLAEAVREMNEAAAILRGVRHTRRRD